MLRRILGLVRDLTRAGKANFGTRSLGGTGVGSTSGLYLMPAPIASAVAGASTSFLETILFVGWFGHASNCETKDRPFFDDRRILIIEEDHSHLGARSPDVECPERSGY